MHQFASRGRPAGCVFIPPVAVHIPHITMSDNLSRDLYSAPLRIPLIDPHSHIDPLAPVSQVARRHPRLPLLHRAGPLRRDEPGAAARKDVPPRERVRRDPRRTWTGIDNTAQYGWFLDIARDVPRLHRRPRHRRRRRHALRRRREAFAQPDWEKQVFDKTKLEKIFLTNEFDDPLRASTRRVYVPCLRTDTSCSSSTSRRSRQRLAKATGVEVGDAPTLRKAIWQAVRALHGARGRRRARSRCRRTSTRHRSTTSTSTSRCSSTASRPRPRHLLDARRVLPRVPPAVRPDDRRQPPRLRERASTRGRTCSTSAPA